MRNPIGPGFVLLIAMSIAGCQKAAAPEKPATAPAPVSPAEALKARAKRFELNTPYEPPPGDPLVHHASGFAKTMRSEERRVGKECRL